MCRAVDDPELDVARSGVGPDVEGDGERQQVLGVLPFAALLSFPIRTILGEIGPAAYAQGMALLVAWTLVFGALARWIQARGARRYAGVGI